jgi:NitT/TauT family transport system ATP-binding protein
VSAISLDHVSFSYPGARGRSALRNVSCSVSKGEICALVGASGSGKTTILRLIAGLLQPSEGAVFVNGEAVDQPSRRVGVVFQEYSRSLLPWRTVTENVALAFANQNGHRPSGDDIARPIEAVGLSAVRDRYPWELSGGMQQRVAIARALALNSEVILLDEPFGSVDAVARFALEDLLLTTAVRFGLTVLLVTHDIDEAIYMADRVLVMGSSGDLVDSGGVPVPLGRPRSQLDTRGDIRFNELRSRLFGAVGMDSRGERRT